ncbi:MAG: MFS transporter [Candidatus Omnitrophica bacterium]|nr:MFS transporter [Candidatus Omnitrophota bacterium]MBD3269470.1 MFS transporter [Candidatus Omnitrophota bacterium]
MDKSSKKTFIFLCGLVFILSFSVQATAALIPTLAAYFRESPIVAGKLVWFYMLPYGLCALVWAPLSRKISVKKILIFCLTVFSFSSLLVASSTSLAFAFLGRLSMGVFGSSLVPLSLITIGKEYGGKEKPKYVGIFFSVGFSSGLAGVFLSGILPWRLIYGIPALLSFLAAVSGFLLIKDLDYRGKFKISYLSTFKDRGVLKLFSFIFVLSFLYHSTQQWLGVYLSEKYQFSQFFISSALTVSALAAIFSESIGGFLSSRFGSDTIASLGLISMVIFIFISFFLNTPAGIFFLIVFWGGGWAFNHVGLSSFLAGLPDKFLRDASSLNSSLRFVSGGLGTYFGGKSIAGLGFFRHLFIVGIALFLISFLIKKHLKIRTQEAGGVY